MTRRLAAILFPLLAVTAVAQTFVVDEANGPGAHFTDLPTAVASVPDGAVLLVRPGLYDSPILNSRSLTLFGEPGARLVPAVTGGLSISSLAPHQSVVVRGFTFADTMIIGSYEIWCQQCAGAVVLEQLSGPAGIQSSIRATSCDRLLVRNCVFNSPSRLRDCHAVLENCTIAPPFGPAGGTALEITRGTTQVVGGTLHGVTGYLNQGGPAVASDNAALRVLGAATLAGGAGQPQGFAVAGTGTLRIDPGVTVAGANPPFAAGVQVTVAPQALVVATDPILGNPVTAELRGPIGDLGALAVGLPGLSHAVPGIADRLFWNGATTVTQAIGVIQVGAPITAVVAVPNQQSLLGLQLVWHGVTFATTNGLQVSPPAWYVVRQ